VPPAVVQNGYSRFVSRLAAAQQLPEEAQLALHTSWSGRSLEGKLHRLREATLYADGGA
jgi:hypothetical protein